MKNRYFITALLGICISVFLLPSCEEPKDEPEFTSDPIEMYLDKSVDTMLVLTGDDIHVNVFGVFIEESETPIQNSGVLTDTIYYVYSQDTLHTRMTSDKVDWFSSNSSVVQVTNGVAEGKSAGTAAVWAEYNTVVSDSLVFVVSTPELPPELILDPPLQQLVFQDSGYVSGRTTPGLDVTLTIRSDTTDVLLDGTFGRWVSLTEGVNPIQVRAVNNENGLSKTKQKTFIYYSFESSGIAGHWSGTTLTRPFSFDIYERAGEYIIDGTLTIDLTMISGPMIIRDIVLWGLINPDGTIDAELSKEWEDFTLTGFMAGYFHDSGHSRGRYGVQVTHPGWPPATLTATWTAEKDD